MSTVVRKRKTKPGERLLTAADLAMLPDELPSGLCPGRALAASTPAARPVQASKYAAHERYTRNTSTTGN